MTEHKPNEDIPYVLQHKHKHTHTHTHMYDYITAQAYTQQGYAKTWKISLK
jgi:hypothetical protein